MRICIISNFKKNGYGESTRPYFLSLFLKKQGHKIIHLCHHSGTEDGIQYVKINTEYWEPSWIKRAADFIPLYTQLCFFAPDIIYCHQLNIVRWAESTKILPKSILIMDAHTSMYFELNTFGLEKENALAKIKTTEQEAFRKTDFIICASEETRQILIKEFGLSAEKLFTVGNATGILPVTINEERLLLKNTTEAFTCLATLPQDGFFSNEMALSYLFEIAAIVHTRDSTIKFIVIGGGQKPTPPTPNITYTGYVQDIRAEILSANICMMPFPDKAVCGGARNKFCDYIALGKLVVTSSEGLRGMKILIDKENCLVAKSAQEFAETILQLSKQPDRIKAMEKEVFKIRDYYNWEDRAKQVGDIFESIVKHT